MPGGCCIGGIPGLGPCMTAGPGIPITCPPGDPICLSVAASEDVPLSAFLSLLDSSVGFSAPVAGGENPAGSFVGSKPVGMKGGPAVGMDGGDSMMGPGKAGGLPMGAAC